jgi:hypothetical protein
LAYTIFIQRKWQTALSTISEFNIPGTEIKGYFLECPGPDTETPNLNKRIPEGHYSLVWHASNKFAVHNPVPKLFNAKVPSYSSRQYAWRHSGMPSAGNRTANRQSHKQRYHV